jgi:uncharacterized membrane protein YraQ (UPF0718 family)
LNSILLGFFSYFTAQLLSSFQHLFVTGDPELRVWSVLVGSPNLPFGEIVFATLLAIAIGFVATAIIQKKLVIRVAKYFNATTKFGDENLFSAFLNSPDVQEVYVRLQDKDIVYHGVVHAFSETQEISEILLADVAVYKSTTSELMYEVKQLYLSLPKQNVQIELPRKS